MKLHFNHLKTFRPGSLPVIGSVLACLFWFVDSAIDTFIFEQQRLYVENLLRPETFELWMRFQIVFLIMSLSILTMFMMSRQRKISKQLETYKRELENVVIERTSNLSIENAILEKEIMERLKVEADLMHLATIDPLTSISNRRKFNEVLDYELQRDARYENDLSLILCDLDHFKHINDKYGHNIGDEVLKEFTQLVSKNIRQTDVFARWGGEEFVLLLPESDISTAIEMAKKLRIATEKHQFTDVGKITASFGVTQLMKDDDEKNFINRADEALYIAKDNGRNKVESLPSLQISLNLFPTTKPVISFPGH